MASDTTAALVLAHSWGDRRRRFIWVAPEGYENQAGMFAAAHESGGRRKGLLLLLRVRAAEVGPFRTWRNVRPGSARRTKADITRPF